MQIQNQVWVSQHPQHKIRELNTFKSPLIQVVDALLYGLVKEIDSRYEQRYFQPLGAVSMVTT